MKKIVVILLLILPFVLIYSVSFTGRILSQYTHIPVERLVLLDENANEYEDGTTIQLGKGEIYTMRVKVLPELANNQEFTIANLESTVCEVSEETLQITALEYGTSEIVLTSKDTFVTFSFKVRVADDDIQEIVVNKTLVELGIGKSETIEVGILPITTLPENRALQFISENENIAKVNANGKVTAVAEGETFIIIRSQHKPSVESKVKITVIADKVEVVSFSVNGTYTTSESTLDLTTLTVFGVENYTDLKYRITSGSNNAELTDGIVTFKKTGVYKIEVSVKYDGQTYTDTLTVLFT